MYEKLKDDIYVSHVYQMHDAIAKRLMNGDINKPSVSIYNCFLNTKVCLCNTPNTKRLVISHNWDMLRIILCLYNKQTCLSQGCTSLSRSCVIFQCALVFEGLSWQLYFCKDIHDIAWKQKQFKLCLLR